LRNAGYHSVQSHVSSTLLTKNIKIKIYKTMILHLVLYGCDIWSLRLREERRLKVSENRVLRRIYVTKRNQVTKECRKLHNGEFNDLYSSPNIVRLMNQKE
jgi:hypothetical protein